MKKTLAILLALLLFATVLTACQQEPEPVPTQEPTPEPTEEATPEPTEEATPEPTEEPNPVPDNASPTTGLTDTTTEYKPLMVQIDNEPGGRKRQENIQLADVVYETMIEGSDTRLSCIFNDAIYSAGHAEKITVGPVRSSRYYHQWIQSEWDCLYVHNGGPDSTGNPESDIWGASGEHVKQRINGAGKGAVNVNMFYRNDRGERLDAYAMTDLIADAALYNYTPTERKPFQYYPLETYDSEQGIERIDLSFNNSPGWVNYRYDSATDKLVRYMGDTPFKDTADETREAIEVQNLIVQYVHVSVMPSDSPRRKVDVFGTGKAEFIIHGKHLTGTWERKDETVSTKYYLDSGEEVTLTPGNTWIAMHPEDEAAQITYADGTRQAETAEAGTDTADAVTAGEITENNGATAQDTDTEMQPLIVD